MITIYQEPTDKIPRFGIMWPKYSNMQICGHEDLYPNLATALDQLDKHKAYIILDNFEAIRLYFQKWAPEEIWSQHEREAVGSLRQAVIDCLPNNNVDSYDKILEIILSKKSFVKVIIKSTPQEHRGSMRMMASSLMRYCKTESDDRQKNKTSNGPAQ